MWGAVGASAALGASALIGRWEGRSDEAAPAPARHDLDSRVDALLASASDDVLAVAVRMLHDGASLSELLGLATLLPLLTGGDGEDIHALATIAPITELALNEALPEVERQLAALWAVESAHAWAQPQRVALALEPLDHDLAGLRAHLDADDALQAKRAADTLVSWRGLDAAMALLRTHATRRQNDVHVPIWAFMAGQLVETVGEYAPLLARSVAAYATRDAEIDAPPRLLATDEEASVSAFEVMRALDWAPRTSLDGVSSQTLWEVMALRAVETRLADTSASGLGVHHTTSVDALWSIWKQAAPEERPEMLARAVRRTLERRAPVLGATRVTELEPSVDDPFERVDDDPVPAYRAALHALSVDEDGFIDRVNRHVLSHATEPHAFKHWSSVLRIAGRSRASVRHPVLASMMASHVMRSRSTWWRREEATRLLRQRT